MGSSDSKQPPRSFPIFEKIETTAPLVCCHRGGGNIFGPENTLHSFRAAVHVHKVDMLEIDVRVSKDGKLVIMHDDTLERTTNGNIEHYTLEEIKKLDAADRYPELRGTGITIPTLEEVLDEFAAVPGLIIMFDFKSKAALADAFQAVKDRNIEDKIIVGAVSPEINREMMRIKPAIIPGAVDWSTAVKLVSAYYTGTFWMMNLDHDIFGFVVADRTKGVLTKGMVDAIHKRGKKVAIFGPLLDYEDVQRKYFDMGCDLILSDRPDVLRNCVDKIKKEKLEATM